MSAAFSQIDRNKDGTVDRAELSASAAQLPTGAPLPSFDELDRNHDGKLDSSELFAHGG